MAEIATLVSPTSTSDRSTSQYGKACTNCSKAKCKCTYSSGQIICERCDRLQKQCVPLIPARKRSARPSNAVVKQQRLEQKLDSLVSLLQAQGQSPVNDATPLQAAPSAPPEKPMTGYWPSVIQHSPAATTPSNKSIPSATTAPTSPESLGLLSDLPRNDEALEGERILARFRDDSLQFFPFIYFPPHLTARQLRHDFPNFWLSISAMSAKSMTQLCIMSDRLQKTVLDKIFVQGERSLDLLFAILSFVGWFRHQRKQKPFFNMWTQMAASLAVELGLNKSTNEEPAFFCHLTIYPYTKSTAKRERTMQERRAVLATFLMTSGVSTAFRKADTMQWTPAMEESLRFIEARPEWEGDKTLALQIRCQLVIEHITESPWLGGSMSGGSKKGAPDYFIKSMVRHLEEARSKIGTLSPLQNDLLQLSVHHTDLTTHEASQELPLTEPGVTISHKKLEPYYNALYSIKAWLELFFTVPIQVYPDLTFSLFCQFIHCIVSLYRLSTLDDPAWDRPFVKGTMDIVRVIERFASNVEQVKATRNLILDNDEEDLFSKSAGTMRKLAEAWGNEIAAITARQGGKQGDAKGEATGAGVGEVEIPPELMDVDLWDGEWLADMFLSWEG